MLHLHRRLLTVAAIVGCTALLAPSGAGAAVTKKVYAGPPPNIRQIAAKLIPNLKRFGKRYSPDINAFFNRRTTINVGDAVSFKIRGFHTIDIPAKGGSDLPLIVPGGPIVTGVNDAAGSPFWFNGKLPVLGFDPALLGRSKSTSYNGASRLDSGFLSPKPFKVRFTKAGTYKYFCDVHAGMVGYVTVKPKGQAIPSAKQDLAASTAQAVTVIKAAAKLPKLKLPADTVSLGASAPGGIELYTMFPATLTVKPGTTVTFKMSARSLDFHTATFGPVPYLTPILKSFQGAPTISPIGTYLSDPPGTTPKLTPTSHGNGFVNTGILDRDAATKQFGPASKIDFTTPGTYTFVCLIHPNMVGRIIVK